MTRILGAILAGGRSSRFGSDKAAAVWDGATLLDRVVAALAPQTEALLVCGRTHPTLPHVPDRPAPDLGPLGGLAAALYHAAAHGFDAVVSVPCDTPLLPGDLVARLSGKPVSHAAEMPVIGLWPARLAPMLDRHLAAGGNRSMRGWIEACDAAAVDIGAVVNINRVADLDLLPRHPRR